MPASFGGTVRATIPRPPRKWLEQRQLLGRQGLRRRPSVAHIAGIARAGLADPEPVGQIVHAPGDLLLVRLGRVGTSAVQALVLRDQVGALVAEPRHEPLPGAGPK